MNYNVLLKIVASVFFLSFSVYGTDTVSTVNIEQKRYECSLYGNLSTIGSNIYFESDIGAGFNFLDNLNISLTLNLQYRNYSFVTNEFISFGGKIDLKKHKIRAGITGGLYTQRTGSFSDAVPCGGIELLYAYKISDNVSLCLKERVVRFSESDHKITASSTLIGFVISFYNVLR